MERKEFIKKCCFTAIGVPAAMMGLSACGGIYYATNTIESERVIIAKSEFIIPKKDGFKSRDFVLIKTPNLGFPICVYQFEKDQFVSSLLECTHRGCEVNVGGSIFTCPCHGSEFTNKGEVIQGPAEKNLKTFRTETDNENIYIYLS